MSDTTALPVGDVIEKRVEDPAARVPVSKSGTAAAAVAPACASWSVCPCAVCSRVDPCLPTRHSLRTALPTPNTSEDRSHERRTFIDLT